MFKTKLVAATALATGAMLLSMTAAPAVWAATQPNVIEHSVSSNAEANGEYQYSATIEVTITNADSSLTPVLPSFQFANAMPTFTPTSDNGSGTFTLPAGYTSEPATSVTLDTAKSTAGIFVYDVGVPADMQTSKYTHLFVYANYQWSAGGSPVSNYSTLINLVQALPELPFAVLVPAMIVGGWLLKRRSDRRTRSETAGV